MSVDSKIRAHVGEVSYRFGKLAAERKETLTTDAPVEEQGEEQVTQEFNVTFSLVTDAVLAEIVQSASFIIEVLVAGRWELADTAPEDQELRREFAQTFALPRLVAIAESKASSLACEIDVPLPVFNFAIDNHLLENNLEKQT